MCNEKSRWTEAESLIRDCASPNSGSVVLTPNECRAIVGTLDRLRALRVELAEAKAQLEADRAELRRLHFELVEAKGLAERAVKIERAVSAELAECSQQLEAERGRSEHYRGTREMLVAILRLPDVQKANIMHMDAIKRALEAARTD